MQTMLEIFYVRIMGKQVRFQRKMGNLSKRGSDPNKVIEKLLQEKRQTESGEVEQREFIVHSTSWRYEPKGKVVLTYVAYSDELDYTRGKTKQIPVSKMRIITKKKQEPRSQTELEKQVVSHAMRHIAFLIQTNALKDVENALTLKTKKVFERLWVSLAGKVY